MKVVPKIVLAFVFWTFLVLVLQSYQRLQREIALLEGDLFKECRLVGALVRDELARLWLDSGEQAVLERADALIHDQWAVSLRPVSRSASPREPDSALIPADQIVRAIDTPVRVDSVEPPIIVTYVLLPEVSPDAALELSASLEGERQFIHRAIYDLIYMIIVITLISLVFSFWAGWSIIGRRIARMIAVARGAARHDFQLILVDEPSDELDELGLELNLMSHALRQSHELAEQERHRREALAAQLLHADRLATVGGLLSQVAHEIGTPLSVIRGRLGRARTRIEEDSPVQRELEIATEQVDRVSAIIRNMLDYARGNATKSVTSARRLVERAIELIETLAIHNGITFDLTHQIDDAIQVQGDLLALEQALVNVLINALDASPAGAQVTLHTSLSDTEGRRVLCIAITDAGEGVPEALAEKIFEPFFSTKPAGKGTGMGLMIASTILRDHHGSLELDTHHDAGARFIFKIPIEESAS